jgi:transcriptional regulator with GAF, ATPase, and Fis domain
MGKRMDSIPKHCINQMLQYDWPGNVREFEHLIERSMIISQENSFILGDQLKSSSPAVSISNKNSEHCLASIERDHIMHVLHMTEWKIEGPGGAASILNLHPSTLRFRIKKLGIKRPV